MIKIFALILFLIYMFSVNIKIALLFTIIVLGSSIYLKKNNLSIILIVSIYLVSLIYKNNTEKFKIKSKVKVKENFENNNSNNSKNSNNKKSSNVVDLSKDIVLTEKNYEEILFCFRSILDSNFDKDVIDKTIKNYNIKDIYSFADKILNLEKDSIYNNLLDKITNKNENGETNYFECNNENYDKLYAFSELIKVYTLSIEKVLEIINLEKYKGTPIKIRSLCDLSSNRHILNHYDNQTSYGYEYQGLLYYLNEKSINEKYFKILELLELDKLLDDKRKIPLYEKLYYYNNKNTKISKDLNSIMVLFDYYEIFDKLRINNEEDDYNWNYGILKSIDLNKNYWENNEYFVKYNIKERIINTINKFSKENNEDDIFSIQLNNKYDETFKKSKDKKSESDTYLKEYKIIKELNDKSNKIKEVNVLDLLSVEYLKNNFSQTFIDILEDLVNLYSKRCKLDCPNDNTYLNKIKFYIINIFKVFTKKGRLLYVGLFVILITFILYFIEISK
tara:strand:+ start:57 stop:1571 length:1515 start_codon:yes stop_codon:yes gene_type:complete